MTLQDATPTASRIKPLRLPDCPLCGDMLLAPMLAEHVNEHHVRNHWACESCGHTFRRTFEVPVALGQTRLLCDA